VIEFSSNRKEIQPKFSPKHVRLKRGDVSGVERNLRAECYVDKWEVQYLFFIIRVCTLCCREAWSSRTMQIIRALLT
jgi:hypothetical protein